MACWRSAESIGQAVITSASSSCSVTPIANWRHQHTEFEWRKPEDFELIKKQPRENDEDSEKESQPIPTWKQAELKTLWEYALPLERVLILLGLNCAYGADQAGRLRIHHVKFRDTEDQISFIHRIRRKKKTLSVHALWGNTVEGLKWAIARRPESEHDHVLLNQNGNPYWRLTKGSNRAQDIPNIWSRLLNRIQKDDAEFRRLPFNSLRDTSGDFVRQLAGGETASLHLAHKHQTDDENLGRYTNPPRGRHDEALLLLEEKLASIFADVADPFPAEMKKIQSEGQVPNISLGKIRRIRKLFSQGYKRAKIAEVVGVSKQTVYLTEEAVTRALVVLVKNRFPASALDRILYFHSAQSDRLLFDVVVNVLVPQQAQGLTDIDADDIQHTLAKWVREEKTTSEWNENTTRRVSQGLLATLRDFGVLQGATNKKIDPAFVPIEAFAYIVFYLKQHQPSGAKLLVLPDWKLFFLPREGVERFLFEAHQRELLEYHVAGSVTRLTFPSETLEEYANVLAQR